MLQRNPRKRIAIIGSGIAGLCAAWLLNQRHDITLFERDARIGGHSNTVDAGTGGVAVDTGFIVYNESTYPNLTALFRHIEVETTASDMSLGLSMRGGELEYAGNGFDSLFAQRKNILQPRFWSMLRDLVRFYRTAPRDLASLNDFISLREYLDRHGYGEAFRFDHLLPMSGAIWSATSETMLDYPAKSFIRFFHNHGLLKLYDRPVWRTVKGGSREYVKKLTASFAGSIRTNHPIASILRNDDSVVITGASGETFRFDAVVIAAHADQSLAMLADASPDERGLLGAFRYSRNETVLHTNPDHMPKLRKVWSSWNYIAANGKKPAVPTVTYWMNRLQKLDHPEPLFVTLNPQTPIAEDRVIRREIYEHPLFNAAAISAQQKLWTLQGQRNTWFCGSYFGAGFHEDALQSGLAAAEEAGGVRRPWTVENESDRIHLAPARELAA